MSWKDPEPPSTEESLARIAESLEIIAKTLSTWTTWDEHLAVRVFGDVSTHQGDGE